MAQIYKSNNDHQKPGISPLVWIAALVIVLGLVYLGFMLSRQAPPPVNQSTPLEISVAEAAQKRDEGAFILDVRQPEEWNEFHIPDATLIPLDQLPDRLSEVPKDREVVVVCRSGGRSATGRDILRDAGYSTVSSMAGGMIEWQQEGFPTVSGP